MGAMSIWHWLILLVLFSPFLIAPMIPIATILKKAGFSPWWTLIYLVPVANVLALFIFAYSKWPSRP